LTFSDAAIALHVTRCSRFRQAAGLAPQALSACSLSHRRTVDTTDRYDRREASMLISLLLRNLIPPPPRTCQHKILRAHFKRSRHFCVVTTAANLSLPPIYGRIGIPYLAAFEIRRFNDDFRPH
jgi:hypothetical protein